jgi:hypothetical protein
MPMLCLRQIKDQAKNLWGTFRFCTVNSFVTIFDCFASKICAKTILYQLCLKMIDKEILKLQWLMPILQQNKHTERSDSMRHFDV